MDPTSILVGALVAFALGLVAFAFRSHWMPTAQKAEMAVEDDALKAGMALLSRLMDKSTEQQTIASAQASMAHKDAMLAQLGAAVLKASGTPPAP